MSEVNPFAVTPEAGFSHDADPHQDPTMRNVIELLRQTRPWVRFLGIVALVVAGLMVLGGMLVLGSTAMAGPQGMARLGIVAVAYMLMAVLHIYPAICLLRYASTITIAERSRHLVHVAEALERQKSFWRYAGILTAVILIIYLLLMVLGLMMGVRSAFG